MIGRIIGRRGVIDFRRDGSRLGERLFNLNTQMQTAAALLSIELLLDVMTSRRHLDRVKG